MKILALIGGVALAGLTVGSAYADFTLTGYTLPTGGTGGWSPTTYVPGTNDANSGWGGYTGVISVTTSGGNTFTTFCTDLDHYLQTGTPYTIGALTENGQGAAISEATSSAIGQIAYAGVHGNNDTQVAAQAAIWVLAYSGPSDTIYATNFSDAAQLADYTYFTTHSYADLGYAEALIPGGDWPGNGASQELVIGAPEPSTWAMMALGFAGLGFAGYRTAKAKAAFV